MGVEKRLMRQGATGLVDCAAGEAGDEYFAMFFEKAGKNLLDFFADGSSTEKIKIDAMADAALTLHLLHEQGVCHRDIDPENLLILTSNRVGMCDFGCAAFTIGGALFDRSNVGKKYCNAPELLQSEGTDASRLPYAGYPADVFSLGITFFYIIYGAHLDDHGEVVGLKLPWPVADDTADSDSSYRSFSSAASVGLGTKTLKEIADQFSTQTLSENMAELLARMLHPDPIKRPTAQEVHFQLKVEGFRVLLQ